MLLLFQVNYIQINSRAIKKAEFKNEVISSANDTGQRFFVRNLRNEISDSGGACGSAMKH